MPSLLSLVLLFIPLAHQAPAQDGGPPLGDPLGGSEDQDPNRKYEYAPGRRVEVFASWHSERTGNRIAASCGALADEVLDVVAQRFDLQAPQAEGQPAKLLINLYRRPKEIKALLKSIGVEAKSVRTYHSPGIPEVHVAVQPGLTDVAYSKFGAPAWLQADVAEAAALAWVDWVAPGLRAGKQGRVLEGLVLTTIQTGLVERGLFCADPMASPSLNAEFLAMRSAWSQSGQNPREGDLAWWELPLDDPLGRGSRRLLAGAFFAAGPRASAELMEDWDLGAVPDLLSLFAQVAATPVSWELESGLIARSGEQMWLQTSRGNGSARCWFYEPAGSQNYAIEGTVAPYASLVREGKQGRTVAQANVMLGRRGQDFFMVGLGTSSGVVVFNYVHATGEYRKLLEQSNGVTISMGRPVDFRIVVRPGTSVVEIGGEPIGTFTTGNYDLSGQYGIGAQGQRGLAEWSNVRLVQLDGKDAELDAGNESDQK